MENHQKMLDSFFRTSYHSLFELGNAILDDTDDHEEPVKEIVGIFSTMATTLLDNTALPDFLRARITVLLAVISDDGSVAQDHYHQAHQIWSSDRAGSFEYATEVCSWLEFLGVYGDDEVPFPYEGHRAPDSCSDAESDWDIVDEVDAQSDWTEDDVESISDSGSSTSPNKPEKPTVPPKSPEPYELFTLIKQNIVDF